MFSFLRAANVQNLSSIRADFVKLWPKTWILKSGSAYNFSQHFWIFFADIPPPRPPSLSAVPYGESRLNLKLESRWKSHDFQICFWISFADLPLSRPPCLYAVPYGHNCKRNSITISLWKHSSFNENSHIWGYKISHMGQPKDRGAVNCKINSITTTPLKHSSFNENEQIWG